MMFNIEPYIIPELKSVLVEYKGGGYDGNNWEWNFFMYDASGDWHNLLSSGYKGADTPEKATKLLASDDRQMYRQRVSFYDLSDPADMIAFVDGMTATFAKQVDKSMRDQGLGKLWGHCYQCGELREVADMNEEHFTGDGQGTAYFAKDLFCSEACVKEAHDE